MSLLALGCSKKTEPAAKPEPALSSSAATALTAPEKAPGPPPPVLAYKLVKKFAQPVSFSELSNGVIMCESCTIGDKPIDTRPLFSFDGTELKELTGLVTDKRVSGNLGQSITSAMKVVKGGSYSFAGSLPKPILLQAYGDWDDDNIERNGKAVVEHYLKYDGARWSTVGSGEWYAAQRKPSGHSGKLPREYDDALLHAPRLGYQTSIIAFGKGPLLIATPGQLDRWDGKSWQSVDASWQTLQGAHRLEDGRTLIAEEKRLQVVDTEGKLSTLELPDSTPEDFFTVMVIQNKPWIRSSSALWIPSETGIVLATPKPRETTPQPTAPPTPSAAVAVPAPPPSGAPTDGAAPTTSAVPVPSALPAEIAAPVAVAPSASAQPNVEGIPPMTGFSASCKTPFVVLFTPPNPGWRYDEAAQNLQGAQELQDKLWFFEFTRNKVTYFGAQAADEASARALMAAYSAKVPKSKPILGCLDAKAYLPDRYQDKFDAMTILINLRAGFVL